MLQSCIYKLYYKKSVISDQTTHDNRPGTVIPDQTVEEVYLIDVAISNMYRTTFITP
jgi:hypothetical protein